MNDASGAWRAFTPEPWLGLRQGCGSISSDAARLSRLTQIDVGGMKARQPGEQRRALRGQLSSCRSSATLDGSRRGTVGGKEGEGGGLRHLIARIWFTLLSHLNFPDRKPATVDGVAAAA